MLWAWWLHFFFPSGLASFCFSPVSFLGAGFLDFSKLILSLSGLWSLSDKINLEKSKGGSEQKQIFFGKDFFMFLGSILSQPIPVPGRDKIIPKKIKAHNNKKEKHRH